jgi:hypothetical protein
MATSDDERTAAVPPLLEETIDFRRAAKAALRSAVMTGLVGGGLYILSRLAESHAARVADETQRNAVEAEDGSVEQDAAQAARLLGVDLDANADEIRAALRAKLGASCLHPDHGGDGIGARELIDAKNLLIERLHEVES